jgi:hypothetical protein
MCPPKGKHEYHGPSEQAVASPQSFGGEAMRRSIYLTLMLIVASPGLVMAQIAGSFAGSTQCYENGRWVTERGNCPASGGGSGAGGNYANTQLQQAIQQATTNFITWLLNGGQSPQQVAQRQQMLAELQRRQVEAARLHREEEARRLAEMYNRLTATLKLNGLPNLQLKNSGTSVGGLQMKLGDSTQGYGIPGLPGMYTGGPGPGSGMTPATESKLQLKMGDSAAAGDHVGNPNLPGLALNDGQQSYGIPGLPGIYTGGPGPGSGMTPQAGPGLQMKLGDGNAAPAAAPASAGAAFDPSTVDVNNMTPKQAADMAEYVSKLPPEEQQRLMSAAQNAAGAPQQAPISPVAGSAPGAAAQMGPAGSAPESSPVVTPQTAAQPIASLQQQANASQAAAAAALPEDASAQARAGFDTGLGAVATPPAMATTSGQPATSAGPALVAPAPATAPTVYRDRTADSAARPPVTVARPAITVAPTVNSSPVVRPSPSAQPAIPAAPAPGGTRHIESVGECLSRYAQTGPSGATPSLEELHKKLEFERRALEKLLETQKRENEERKEWLKDMRKAAQDVALNAIDKGVEGLFDSSKEALQDSEVELHEEIQETTEQARELRQQMDEARKAVGTAKDDPARVASLQDQWADMEKNQIQPLLEKRKALEGQWESTFKWETRVDRLTNARDFGAWITDMELPCDYANGQVACNNFKENNAISKIAAGDRDTELDGLKMALKYAAHKAERLKNLSDVAVIGGTAGKIAANATFIGEVWDTTSLMIDLSYDATVGYLGYQRLQQVKQNDAQFEKAKSILGARIDRMNAEVSCYQNAN